MAGTSGDQSHTVIVPQSARRRGFRQATIAHLFNRSAQRHQGKVEAVYNAKGVEDWATWTCVFDLERG